MSPSVRTFSAKVMAQVLVQGLLVLRGLVVIPILTKTLGTVSYSIWTQIVVTISLLSPILIFRFETVFVRYFSSDSRDNPRQIFSAMFFLILILLTVFGSFLWFFRRPAAAFIFKDPGLEHFILSLIGLLTFRSIFLFVLSYYRARYKIGLYSLIQCLQLIGEIGILLLSISVFRTSLSRAIQFLILWDGIVALASSVSVFLKIGTARPHLHLLKPYILFALPLIPNVSLIWIINFCDRYVITHVLGLEKAGIYAASYALGQFLQLMIIPLSFVLYPTISKLWEDGKRSEVVFWLENSIKYFLFVAVPAIGGLHVVSSFALRKLATEAFVQPYLVLLIGSGFLFYGIAQILVYVLHLLEKPAWIFYTFLFVACFNLLTNILVIPVWGIAGAAITTLVSYWMQFGILWVLIRRRFPMRLPVLLACKSLLCTLLMAAGISLFSIQSWFALVLMVLGGALFYMVGMRLLGAWGDKELKLAGELIRRPISKNPRES